MNKYILSRLSRSLLPAFKGGLYSGTGTASISTKRLVYEENGDPAKVIKLKVEEIDESRLGPDQVLVQWLASPINPSDINQIQGVYPIKPRVPAIGGNEGCAVVVKVGSEVNSANEGALVIPAKAGIGTWCTHNVYDSNQLWAIDKSLPKIAASMLQVNPSTAFRMLHDFVALEPGDIVVQNGANSAVGRNVIQMCRILGLKSVNVVRDREDIAELKDELKALGADLVLTEEEFAKSLREINNAKLALNCVGGRSSLLLARALGHSGTMVTYGGMSMNPVQTTTSSLIFNDIVLCGFWMSRWYDEVEQTGEFETRREMYETIGEWYKTGELKVVPHHETKIEDYESSLKIAISSSKEKQVFVF